MNWKYTSTPKLNPLLPIITWHEDVVKLDKGAILNETNVLTPPVASVEPKVNEILGKVAKAVVKLITYTPVLTNGEIVNPEPCAIVLLAFTLPLIILSCSDGHLVNVVFVEYVNSPNDVLYDIRLSFSTFLMGLINKPVVPLLKEHQ